MHLRSAGLAVTTLSGALFVVAPAAALAGTSTLSYSGNASSGTLTLTGDSNAHAYTVTYATSAGTTISVAFSDADGTITSPGAICSPTSGTVTCTADATHRISNVVVNGGSGSDALSTAGNPIGQPLTFNGNGGADTLHAGPESDTFNGGAGTDTATYGDFPGPVNVSADGVANDGASGEADDVGADVEEIDGSAQADTLTATSTPSDDASAVKLVGNGGGDTLNAGSFGTDLEGDGGDDTLVGGTGDDRLDEQGLAGLGADDMHGGRGFDQVSYVGHRNSASALVAVNVSLDGIANDGYAGEGDNVHKDIESIEGTNLDDALTGGAAFDQLEGFGGSDTLDGGAGTDILIGDEGNDTFHARDSHLDVLECGAGLDTATTDYIDQVFGCETNSIPPPETKITKVERRVQVKSKHVRARVPVRFRSDEADSTFRCKLDAGPYVSCLSPDILHLKKGVHTFKVRAKNANGDVDPSPARATIRVTVRS
jgi:Ca2+-binding RTX toxin-like protein